MTSQWRLRPWWMFWRRERYVRSVYAPCNIGGGWDGWEFADSIKTGHQEADAK
jgi:hypothetical protein